MHAIYVFCQPSGIVKAQSNANRSKWAVLIKLENIHNELITVKAKCEVHTPSSLSVFMIV